MSAIERYHLRQSRPSLVWTRVGAQHDVEHEYTQHALYPHLCSGSTGLRFHMRHAMRFPRRVSSRHPVAMQRCQLRRGSTHLLQGILDGIPGRPGFGPWCVLAHRHIQLDLSPCLFQHGGPVRNRHGDHRRTDVFFLFARTVLFHGDARLPMVLRRPPLLCHVEFRDRWRRGNDSRSI